MEYTEVIFTPGDPDFSAEILAAVLGEAGFDMFEEKDGKFAAYILTSQFDEQVLSEQLTSGIPAFRGLQWAVKKVPFVNWNAEWEKNFEPVSVGDKVHIRAEYHPEASGFSYQIVIRPGMAFGTGHHATTWMMADEMINTEMTNARVLDMGTGSGVLAILAEMLGAGYVLAVDYDENATENAVINCALNHCSKLEVRTGVMFQVEESGFGIILANINRNIILEDIARYAAALAPGGKLLVSGFYQEDLEMIRQSATTCGLELLNKCVKNNWCQATFRIK